MKRLLLLSVILFAAITSAFTTSFRRDTISVWNNSSQTLIVAVEYRDDPVRVYSSQIFPTWVGNINGMYFAITDILRGDQRRVAPNRAATIARYEVGLREWAIIDQTPSLDLIKSIFRSLRIVTEDGSKVITLENLGEHIIERYIWGAGETFHTIMVFDCAVGAQE